MELGVDEIKQDSQKSGLRRFGQVMWMGEERIHKKIQNTKMEGNWPRERHRARWIDQTRKNIQIRGKNWGKNSIKQRVGG